MNDVTKPKRKRPQVDRIAIGVDAQARLDHWLEQLSARYPGIKMKRGDLAEWIVLNRAATLGADEIREIGGRFYDQVHLARWLLRQLKEAKAAGKQTSIAEIIGTGEEEGRKGVSDGTRSE